jgi:hypothetical protein
MADNSELVNALSGGGLLNSIANPRGISPNLVADSYDKASGIANALWRNKLAQSQQATGDAFRASLNPDGTPNQPRFNQLIANDPNASLNAQTASQAGLENAGGVQTQAGVDMDRGQALVGSLLSANGGRGATYQQTSDALDTGVAAGFIRPEAKVAMLTGMPHGDDDRSVETRRHMMEMINERGQSAQQRLVNARQTQGPDVTGAQGDLQGTIRAPLLGSPTPGAIIPRGAPVPQGPSQDTVFTAPPGWEPDPRAPGSFRPVPRSYPGAAPAAGGGGNPLLGGGPNPAPGSADGTPTMEGQTEGAPGSKATPVGPADRARTAAVQQQKQVSLAPPQGQPDQLATGNKIYTDAATAVPDQQKRLIAGESALQALDIAKTGPGTGTVGKAKAFFEAQGITAPPQGTMSDVDYRQVLVKNLLRFAQDKSKSTGTDLGLETQLHSNANADDMLPNANRHVLVQDLGILRRDMGQTATMPKGAAAIDHVKSFAADIDPRAFATKYMTPDEISTMVKGMGTKEREKFVKSLKVANDSGHVE